MTDNTAHSNHLLGWNDSLKPDSETNRLSESSSTTGNEDFPRIVPSTTKPADINDAKPGSETLKAEFDSFESNSERNASNHHADDEDEEKVGCTNADTMHRDVPALLSSGTDSARAGTAALAGLWGPGPVFRHQSRTQDSSLTSLPNGTILGNPRRKLSHLHPQSIITRGYHSTKGPPVQCSGSLQGNRSMTSACLGKTDCLNDHRLTSDLTRKSPSSHQSTAVDDLTRRSRSQPGVVDGTRKSPATPGSTMFMEMQESLRGLQCVDSFQDRSCCRSPKQTVNSDSFQDRSCCRSPKQTVISDSFQDRSCCRSPKQTVISDWQRRCMRGNQYDAMPVLGATSLEVSGPVRERTTSRLCLEKQHQDHKLDPHDWRTEEGGGGLSMYLTPTQRKISTIVELKTLVANLTRQLDMRELQLQEMRETGLEEKEQIRVQVRQQVEEVRGMAEAARKKEVSLKERHEESVKMVAVLQQQLQDAKKEMSHRLAQAEKMFLEMHNKGRKSAMFEREEELELQGNSSRSMSSTEAEIREQLMLTQAELAKWQTLQRHDSYRSTSFPATEAETTLAFLKDAMFHFLTSDKTQSSDEHLRAVVRILQFSKGQRETIAEAILTRRNKSVD